MDFVKQQLEHSAKIIEADILDYAGSRKKDIERGAETPRLASLLTEKYIMGQLKTLEIISHSLDRAMPKLTFSIDDIVLDIDPNFKEETKLRWEAKPADLIYNTVKR